MKRWLVLIALGASVEACMAMDGERVQKRSAGADASTQGTPPAGIERGGTDASAHNLALAEAGATSGPAVECGSNVCAGSTSSCCASIDTGTCVDSKTTECPGDRFLMRCDDHSDCGTDQVCCAWWDNTQATLVWESACTAKSACKPASSADGQQAVVWMCMSDADCAPGKTCSVEATNWEGTGINIKAAFCSL